MILLIFQPELTNIGISKHPRGKTNEESDFSHYIIFYDRSSPDLF